MRPQLKRPSFSIKCPAGICSAVTPIPIMLIAVLKCAFRMMFKTAENRRRGNYDLRSIIPGGIYEREQEF
jgi:hypothetical protein